MPALVKLLAGEFRRPTQARWARRQPLHLFIGGQIAPPRDRRKGFGEFSKAGRAQQAGREFPHRVASRPDGCAYKWASNQAPNCRMSQTMVSQPCLPPGCTTNRMGRPISRARRANRSD